MNSTQSSDNPFTLAEYQGAVATAMKDKAGNEMPTESAANDFLMNAISSEEVDPKLYRRLASVLNQDVTTTYLKEHHIQGLRDLVNMIYLGDILYKSPEDLSIDDFVEKELARTAVFMRSRKSLEGLALKLGAKNTMTHINRVETVSNEPKKRGLGRIFG